MAMVTMKTIAEEAGVSLMSVSLALRNSPKISQRKREEIQKLAEKMGYRPNPMVATLMSQVRRRKVSRGDSRIAYITDIAKDVWLSNYVHQGYFEGAKARCEERGYELQHFPLSDAGFSGPRLGKILRTRNIQGILVAPLEKGETIEALDWSHFSAAALGNTLIYPRIHRSSAYHYHLILQLLDKLRSCGYVRPGMIATPYANIRADGQYLAGFDVFNRKYSPKKHYPCLLTKTLTVAKIGNWYKECRPDVIVIPWNVLEIQELLKEVGLAIPGDVSLATCSWTPDYSEISGMDQNSPRVGSAAADLVIEQLQHNEQGIPEYPKIVLIEGVWRQGSTSML